MLLLKRRRDQVVQIGPDVVVRVVRIEGGTVVLGITAPPAWRVQKLDLATADTRAVLTDHVAQANA